MTVDTYIKIMRIIIGFGLPLQIILGIKMIKGEETEPFIACLYTMLFLATQLAFIVFQISN